MKVSSVALCLNSQDTIEEIINSVNQEKYNDIEHIFIDGGSIDKIIDVIKNNAKIFTNLLKEPTRIYQAMNEGIRKLSGDVLKTYDDIPNAKDDLDFQPKTSIEEGLKKFVAWFKEYYGDWSCY